MDVPVARGELAGSAGHVPSREGMGTLLRVPINNRLFCCPQRLAAAFSRASPVGSGWRVLALVSDTREGYVCRPMLRPSTKKTPRTDPPVRTTLFGDMPLRAWCGGGEEAEPWLSFVRARALFERDDTQGAAGALREIIAMPGLESRHYLQAWHVLRTMGMPSEGEGSREVLGVVVEVALPRGLDLLAAYADLSARYYNFSGAGIVWEHPDDSLDPQIHAVLDAGASIAAAIGPWEGERPEPPPAGQMRINILTPAGLMFGQAPMNALAADRVAGTMVNAATTLMKDLVDRARSAKAETLSVMGRA
jgi:hypothetical protein